MVESGPFIEYCGSVYVAGWFVNVLVVLAWMMPVADFIIFHLFWPWIQKQWSERKVEKSQG